MELQRLKDLRYVRLRLAVTEILRCAQDDMWNKYRLIPKAYFPEKNTYFLGPRVTVSCSSDGPDILLAIVITIVTVVRMGPPAKRPGFSKILVTTGTGYG
jgi:hypothetical protein